MRSQLPMARISHTLARKCKAERVVETQYPLPRPSGEFHSVFIDKHGAVLKLPVGTWHQDAARAVEANDDSYLDNFLVAHELIRVNHGRRTISLEVRFKPTSKQLTAILRYLRAHPELPFSFDLSKSGAWEFENDCNDPEKLSVLIRNFFSPNYTKPKENAA